MHQFFTYRVHILLCPLLLLMLVQFTGCRLTEVPFTRVSVTLQLPEEALQAGKDGYHIVFRNIATGRIDSLTTGLSGEAAFVLEEGVYNVEVAAQKTITTTITDGSHTQTYTQTVQISGLLEKTLLSGTEAAVSISLHLAQKGNGFVIQEIYYTGSTTPAQGSYYQDQYITIYNNSDSVLYADGLSVVEATHLSNAAVYEFGAYPNDFIAGALYTIPGNGREHPVQPGKSVVIASLGIDHRTANANSPADLSKADFEWYDGGKDVDVPEVPNMIRNFCYSNTIWVMHVKGYKALAIFRAPGSYADFLAENTIQVQTASGSAVSRVKIANSLIIDGVELATAGTIGSKSLSPAIDVSYTYCNNSYTGKSVRRKVLGHTGDGRVILQDTNNSGNDFIPDTTPKPGTPD